MAPPRPPTFERPDLENKRSFIKRFLPYEPEPFALPSSNFRNRITTVREFLRMVYRIHFENNEQEDCQWVPHALLGEGGFGSAGVWKRKNPENGDVVDELAIKTIHFETQERMDRQLWGIGLHARNLLAEAVIQRQLNDAECENIVHLRGYKYFKPPRHANANKNRAFNVPLEKEFKLYLEYAPYDTLESLRLKYRYYHQYLPEAFLWHVFDSLATAANTVRLCHQDGLPYPHADRAPSGNASLIHFDIKLDNIFLGYAERYGYEEHGDTTGGTKVYNYPIVKLGDFGLMNFVNDGARNPRSWLKFGTQLRRPPEMEHYGAYWHQPPNGPYIGIRDDLELDIDNNVSPFNRATGETAVEAHIINDPRNLAFKFSEKVDVWAIGKVMFDLMGLHNPSKLWRLATRRYDRYQRFGNHMIANFDRIPFDKYRADHRSPYSAALTKLVADCLQPNIEERVDVTHLIRATHAGMGTWDHFRHQIAEESPRTPGDTMHPFLFWRDNEINDMPEGPDNFSTAFKEYLKMQQRARSDPDWPHLRPPFDRYTGEPDIRTHHDMYLYLSDNWRRFREMFLDDGENIHLRDLHTGEASSVDGFGDDDNGSEHRGRTYQWYTTESDARAESGTDSSSDSDQTLSDSQQSSSDSDQTLSDSDQSSSPSDPSHSGLPVGRDIAPPRGTKHPRLGEEEEDEVVQAGPKRIRAQSVVGFADQGQGPSRSIQQPPAPPRATSRWTAEYTRAWDLAAQTRIPAVPPDVDPTDITFRWDPNRASIRQDGLYIRQERGRLHWWDQHASKWKIIRVYVNSAANRELGRAGLIY